MSMCLEEMCVICLIISPPCVLSSLWDLFSQCRLTSLSSGCPACPGAALGAVPSAVPSVPSSGGGSHRPRAALTGSDVSAQLCISPGIPLCSVPPGRAFPRSPGRAARRVCCPCLRRRCPLPRRRPVWVFGPYPSDSGRSPSREAPGRQSWTGSGGQRLSQAGASGPAPMGGRRGGGLGQGQHLSYSYSPEDSPAPANPEWVLGLGWPFSVGERGGTAAPGHPMGVAPQHRRGSVFGQFLQQRQGPERTRAESGPLAPLLAQETLSFFFFFFF